MEVRKADEVHPREVTAAFAAVIVTNGDSREVQAVSGAGSATDQGDVLKSYEIGVSIYGASHGNVSTDLDTHPAFVLRCKQALNKITLAGVPTVYGTKLVDNAEWEQNAFGAGGEVSRFGLIFLNAETRLGN